MCIRDSINKQEANLLLQELETYIERIGKERILDERIDFGLISPYKMCIRDSPDTNEPDEDRRINQVSDAVLRSTNGFHLRQELSTDL